MLSPLIIIDCNPQIPVHYNDLYEFHGVSNHRQLHLLFSRLWSQIKVQHYWPSVPTTKYAERYSGLNHKWHSVHFFRACLSNCHCYCRYLHHCHCHRQVGLPRCLPGRPQWSRPPVPEEVRRYDLPHHHPHTMDIPGGWKQTLSLCDTVKLQKSNGLTTTDSTWHIFYVRTAMCTLPNMTKWSWHGCWPQDFE